MPHHFSWVIDGWVAGMGQPGCGLELVSQMLPHERRFLNWLLQSRSLSGAREPLADAFGVRAPNPLQRDKRMLDLYKKFRDIWNVLETYREVLGPGSAPVDRFVLSRARLAEDLAFLREQNIGAIVTLTERPLDIDTLEGFPFQVLHIPVKDREAPSMPQVQSYIDYVKSVLASGVRVVTHCLGGIGRTGTMLACYLVSEGMPSEQAIRELRRIRPESIETEVQEAAVAEYERQIR